MGLRNYIAKRLGYAILLIVMAMSLNFVIFMLMPGELSTVYVQIKGLNPVTAQQELAIFNHDWGLDQPVWVKYLLYLRNMFTWNFGVSMNTRLPVATSIMTRIPWTILLMGISAILATIIGVATGVLAAYKRGSTLDSGLLMSALVFGSLPTFWIGLVLIVIFSIDLGWFSFAGAWPGLWGSPNHPFPSMYTVSSSITPSSSSVVTVLGVNGPGALEYIGGIFNHAFLPILTLTLFLYGGFTLLARATMLEALTEDYIVTARAKGVSETSVLFRHALRNASLPIITTIALEFGFLFSGATITETVFSWPGLGYWIYSSVTLKDFFSMEAIFYIITLMVIIANVIADLLYGVVDPRIKYG
jgi:peptide/nickel transport system permease protein